MFCKFCGTENPDKATFCKHCGKRLDGKTICPACAAQNDADALFCNHCGKQLSAPVAVPAAVAEVSAPASRPAPAAEHKERKPFNWRMPVEICGWAFAMTGLLAAFVFTFLIGFGVRSDNSLISSMIGDSGHNLYYFFGKGYKEAAEAIKAAAAQSRYTEFYELSQYLPLVLGTVISAGVIVSVVTLTVLAVVRFVRRVLGKSEKDFAKLTIAAYLTFVLGALMLHAVYALNVHMSYTGSSSSVSGMTVNAGFALNDATVAGIVIGGVFLFLFLGARVAVKGKQILARENLLSLIFGGVAIVVCSILLGFLTRAAGGYVAEESTSDISISACFPYFIAQMSERYTFNSSVRTAPVGEVIVAIAALAVQIALLVIVTLLLLRSLVNTYEEKRKNTLALAIPVFALAVAYLVLSVVLGDMVQNYMQTRYNLFYTAAIVVLVFAAFTLAAAITQKVLTKLAKRTEPAEEETAEKDLTLS